MSIEAAPERRRLADVLPSALAVLGMPGMADVVGLRARLEGVRRVAVLLIDGLGYHLLPLTRPVAPALTDIAEGRLGTLLELYSGFPSTTPTSLVSLATGVAAGEHGIVGFTVNVPGTSRVLTHIDWKADPDPALWQPVPTLFERAADAGIAARVVSRAEYAGSGLTVAAYRGATYLPAGDPEALAEQVLGALRSGPGLVYGYHPALDHAAHVFGVDSPQWLAAAAEADRLVARIVDGLPADAVLLVTADHGGLNVPGDQRFDLDADARLAAGVAVVAGEARVRYLHTRPGAADDVLAAWRGVLGAAAAVVSREEAVEEGWFGPVPAGHLARIGDVVVVCRDRYVVLATRHEKKVDKLVGFHGGRSPVETAVPLAVLRAP